VDWIQLTQDRPAFVKTVIKFRITNLQGIL